MDWGKPTMKKKLYTNETLFNTVVNLLREKNLLPDILDYDLSDRNITDIRTCEWDCTADLRFGGNEGIYLDVYAEGNLGDGKTKTRLGVFKTLYENKEAFYTMAKLQADFIWEVRDFVNENLHDFDWTGYDVEFYRGTEQTMCVWTANKESVDRVLKRRYTYDFDYAIVIDNETEHKTKINKSEITLD